MIIRYTHIFYKILPVLVFLVSLTSCKNVIDKATIAPNEINITGDFSGNLDVFLPYKDNGELRLSSIKDSTNISYPSFYLKRNKKFTILTVVASEKEEAVSYYNLKDNSHVPNQKSVEFKDMTLYLGEGVVNYEILKKQDSKSIIINGKISQ